MKILNLLTAVALLAAPAIAQHEHDGHAPKTDGQANKMTMATVLVAQTLCPISGEELEDKDNFVDHEGQRIYVCCKKCKKRAIANPGKIAMSMFADGVQLENIQTTDPVSGKALTGKTHFYRLYNKRIFVNDIKSLEKVAANPAIYLDAMEGRRPQARCAVMGGKVNPEANFQIEGMTVGQCCSGCDKKWKSDPAAKFAVLAERKEVVEPISMKCPVMPKMNGSKKFPVTIGAKRYYLCSEKIAMKFTLDPDKYLPGWYAAQGIEFKAVPAAPETIEGN